MIIWSMAAFIRSPLQASNRPMSLMNGRISDLSSSIFNSLSLCRKRDLSEFSLRVSSVFQCPDCRARWSRCFRWTGMSRPIYHKKSYQSRPLGFLMRSRKRTACSFPAKRSGGVKVLIENGIGRKWGLASVANPSGGRVSTSIFIFMTLSLCVFQVVPILTRWIRVLAFMNADSINCPTYSDHSPSRTSEEQDGFGWRLEDSPSSHHRRLIFLVCMIFVWFNPSDPSGEDYWLNVARHQHLYLKRSYLLAPRIFPNLM